MGIKELEGVLKHTLQTFEDDLASNKHAIHAVKDYTLYTVSCLVQRGYFDRYNMYRRIVSVHALPKTRKVDGNCQVSYAWGLSSDNNDDQYTIFDIGIRWDLLDKVDVHRLKQVMSHELGHVVQHIIEDESVDFITPILKGFTLPDEYNEGYWKKDSGEEFAEKFAYLSTVST